MGFKWPRIGAGAPPWLLPTLIGAAIPLSAFGRSLLLVVMIPAIVLTFSTLGDGRRWREVLSLAARPAALALWLVFALWSVSVAGSIDFEKSAFVWARSLLFVPMAIIIAARLSGDPNILGQIQRVLVASAVAAECIILVLIYFEPPILDLLFPFKTGPIQANMVFKAPASAAACLLPVALWSGWRLGTYWKPLAAALIPLTVLAAWGDGEQPARAALGGLVIGAALVGLLYGYSRAGAWGRTILLVLATATCVGVASFVLSNLSDPPATEQEFEEMQGNVLDPHRLIIWKFTLEKAMERPFFGHGIDAINKVEGAGEIIPFFNQEFIPSHPHSWIIEIFAETGAVGLLAMAVALAFLLRQLYGQATAGRDPAAGWAAIALTGVFWGSSLANFSIWAAWWQTSYWLLLAILLDANLQLMEADRI